jgi:hypothetical protein
MLKSFRFAVLIAGVTLGFAAMAQPAPGDDAPPPGQGDGSDQSDPPTRVGRLSFIKGAVSFVPAGENDWVEAQLNRPLVTGDKLWTDTNSRAELEIGSAAIRMDQQSSFDFLNLDDNTAQVELTQGTLNLRVRRLYDGQTYEIDTPTLAFVANRVGEFRIDVQPDGQTTIVSVMHGGGDVYGEGGARFHVDEGQSVTFADPQLQNYQSADIPQADDFDQFAMSRDRRWDDAPSKKYVSEDLIGYQDLDDYGSWQADVPDYGSVWYPTHVDAGWSPYHSGHWAWVGAYGWSWVDDSPWGFAPFHYGRWAYVGNRWGWCPGEIAVRPVYAPALVAFVGGGVSIGISSGPIGWFPLGYRDVYFPSYRVSHGYFANINVYNTRGLNVTVVNNYYGGYRSGHVDYANIHYANRDVRGAVIAVPRDAFVGARPVGGAAVRVDERTFANGRVSGFAAVAPTRASLANGPAARAVPSAGIANRQIVAATRPPAPQASFATRQAALARNPGQPLATSQLRAPATATGAGAGGVARASNVRVVTQAGAPARTAAPTIQARSTVGNPGAVTRTPNTATTPAGVQRGAAPNAVTNAGRPPVNAATTNGPAGRPAATTTTQTQRFDSSRFAHPNGTAPATSTGQAARGGTAAPNTVQNSATRPGMTNATPVTRTPATSPTTSTNQGSRQTNTTQNSRPAVTTSPQSTSRVASPSSNAVAPRTTNATSPQTYRQPTTPQRTVNPQVQQRTVNPQVQQRTVNPQVQQRTVTPQVQQQRTVTPQVQQQRVVTPQPQVQPRNNPAPPPQNRGGGSERGGNNSKDKDDKHGH